MKTEKEKMLAGEMYNPADPELVKDRLEARRIVRIYNETLETDTFGPSQKAGYISFIEYIYLIFIITFIIIY